MTDKIVGKLIETSNEAAGYSLGPSEIGEVLALRARVAQLEAALISMTKGANWKSADKDNMEFEGRVTCYQLDQARAALEDKP